MNLPKGTRLFLSSENKERVFINSGTFLEEESTPTNSKLHYDSDAYRPKQTWRQLNYEEQRIVLDSDNRQEDYSNSILFDRLPTHLSSLLKSLGVGGITRYPELMKRLSEQEKSLREIQDQLDVFFQEYTMPDTHPRFHRIIFNPPGIETLTYYRNDDELIFVGLHIDRSTSFDFSTVEQSMNRICINIGLEDRIFYYVNLTLNQILALLRSKKNVDLTNITIHNIGRIFFREFPDYPVIKVLQAPYEFYIAPTDNILHDGSTLGNTHYDINLVYLGYFNTYSSRKLCPPIPNEKFQPDYFS